MNELYSFRKILDIYFRLFKVFMHRMKKVWWVYAGSGLLFWITVFLANRMAAQYQLSFIVISSFIILSVAGLFTQLHFSKVPMLHMWGEIKKAKTKDKDKQIAQLKKELQNAGPKTVSVTKPSSLKLSKYKKHMKSAARRYEVYNAIALKLQQKDDSFSISRILEVLIENFSEVDDDRKEFLDEVMAWVKESNIALIENKNGINLYRVTG